MLHYAKHPGSSLLVVRANSTLLALLSHPRFFSSIPLCQVSSSYLLSPRVADLPLLFLTRVRLARFLG